MGRSLPMAATRSDSCGLLCSLHYITVVHYADYLARVAFKAKSGRRRVVSWVMGSFVGACRRGIISHFKEPRELGSSV